MGKLLLEVGTEIFMRNYGSISYFGKIDRATDKFAFSGTTKFAREHNGSWVDIVPKEKWSSTSYFIPTEKDKEELKREQLIRFVTKFDYSKLSLDKMIEIQNIIKKTE